MQPQIDIEDIAPSQDFLIMNGRDEDLEAEIADVIAVASNAIRTTMRVGKLVRVKKGKPCEWKSLSVRKHLTHAVPHATAAHGGDNPMNADDETGLPNVYHAVTRLSMALKRQSIDDEKEAARLGQINESVEE